ncbi:MAG: TerB family tellurite resistance protein [Gammaproteobacteria bacterium]
MLAAIRNFFDQHIAHQPDEAGAERRAQIAAAALLVEVARSDESFSEAERQTVLDSVQRRFSLSPVEARELLTLAEAQSREAHDIFQFTSKIDATFTPERKQQLIEELWRAAYSDGVLHEHEEYLIRRVADLLHLSHSAFIAAKLRVLATRD